MHPSLICLPKRTTPSDSMTLKTKIQKIQARIDRLKAVERRLIEALAHIASQRQ